VYENTSIHELIQYGITSCTQGLADALYESIKACVYLADIVFDSKIILKMYAAERIATEHELTSIKYHIMRMLKKGLLLIFGKKRNLNNMFSLMV
jgi:GxxExxY protein